MSLRRFEVIVVEQIIVLQCMHSALKLHSAPLPQFYKYTIEMSRMVRLGCPIRFLPLIHRPTACVCGIVCYKLQKQTSTKLGNLPVQASILEWLNKLSKYDLLCVLTNCNFCSQMGTMLFIQFGEADTF